VVSSTYTGTYTHPSTYTDTTSSDNRRWCRKNNGGSIRGDGFIVVLGTGGAVLFGIVELVGAVVARIVRVVAGALGGKRLGSEGKGESSW
jgi:hypothetical protein